MKQIITLELINRKINESIQYLINENLKNNEPILSGLDLGFIYDYLESENKIFSFWKKYIKKLSTKKISNINYWIEKNNLDTEINQTKIFSYLVRYYS